MRACPECQQQIDDDARFCPFCGAASAGAEPADPMVGATVSAKFKVEAMIGQGGMGKVYRARHLTLDRPVVLKMLHRAYSDDPQIVQRFQREARAASRLNHPNSIAVLDFGAAEDGTLYMAMEYLAGRDLARVVAEEFPLGERRIVKIGAQILSALAEAHAQGIIHRDLKPENVMVEPRRDEPDFVKVLDFGIAKITAAAENEPKLTQAGLVCGTPEYMSPEQARGADLDARSDLYSVGVILYQLATGELPFQSDTPVGFLTKHLAEIPVPPRQKRPEVSEALDALIRRAMEKDRTRRFADAAAMREALLACAAAPAPVATPVPAPPAAPPRQAPPRAPTAAVPAGGTIQVDVVEEVEPPTAAPPTPPAPGRSKAPVAVGAAVAIVAAVVAGMVATGGKQDGTGTPAATPTEAAAAATPAATPTGTATPTATPAAAARPTETATPTGAATPAAAATPTETAPATPTGPAGATATPAAAPPPAALPVPEPVKPAAAAPPVKVAAARVDPGRARALAQQGDARRAAQDIPGAIKAYLAAEAADPGFADLQKKLGLCYQLQGDSARARDRYRRYLATGPEDAAKVRLILETLQ